MTIDRVWLHRKGVVSWLFEPSEKYGEFIHITKNETVYAIIADHKHGKPFYIARLQGAPRGIWVAAGSELRAQSIEFEGAGKYIFPI